MQKMIKYCTIIISFRKLSGQQTDKTGTFFSEQTIFRSFGCMPAELSPEGMNPLDFIMIRIPGINLIPVQRLIHLDDTVFTVRFDLLHAFCRETGTKTGSPGGNNI